MINKSKLSQMIGVHPNTIENWKSKGCPFTKTITGRILYDLDEVKGWYYGRKMD